MRFLKGETRIFHPLRAYKNQVIAMKALRLFNLHFLLENYLAYLRSCAVISVKRESPPLDLDSTLPNMNKMLSQRVIRTRQATTINLREIVSV